MMNAVSAAWKLVNYQLFSRRRLLGILLLLFLPPLFGLYLVWKTGQNFSVYDNLIAGLLTFTLVPYFSLYVGTMVLSEEIEGKTLVYLWSRPRGRMEVLIWKWIFAAMWTVLIIAGVAGLTYLAIFSTEKEELPRSFLMLVWDIRGLALGTLAFLALGFFLSVMARKALVIGLVYAFTWDSFARLLPGFLRKLSLHHYMAVLTSHGDKNDAANSFLKLTAEIKTTESQAILTLLTVAVVLVAASAILIRYKEFSSDDPARSQ